MYFLILLFSCNTDYNKKENQDSFKSNSYFDKNEELNLELLDSIPISKFLRERMNDLKRIKNLNFEDIEDYISFEGGDEFRYPQLYYVDSSKIVFFNPYFKTRYYEPSMDYFSLNGFDFVTNIYYEEGFADKENYKFNKDSALIKTNIFDNKEFLNVVNIPKGTNKLYIKDIATNKIKVVNITCSSDYYGIISGYGRDATNYDTYEIQQAIYFSPFPTYIFLTVDDFKTIFLYDYKRNEIITCSDIRKVFKHGLFLGITNLRNVVLFDDYGSVIKIINKDALLLKLYNLNKPKDELEGVTMFFNSINNTLYYTGFSEKSMSIKIFIKRLDIEI